MVEVGVEDGRGAESVSASGSAVQLAEIMVKIIIQIKENFIGVAWSSLMSEINPVSLSD